MDEYHDLLARAATYREMAENDDGYRRRVLLSVAYAIERQARILKRQSEPPPLKNE